jgi:hypothetical protein
MKSFKDYHNELEEENINENVATGVFKVLGFGAAGLAGAWVVSLMVLGVAKTGRSIIENLKKSYTTLTNKDVEALKSAFNKEKKSSAVKEQIEEISKKKRKFEDLLGTTYDYIENKDFESAHKEYMKLTNAQRAMPELNQSIIEACTKACGEPPIYVKTPGNITYQKIKTVTGNIRIARAAALATQEKIKAMASTPIDDSTDSDDSKEEENG